MKLFIDQLNWPKAWPVKPQTEVEIHHDDVFLFIHYHVKNDYIRAVAVEDQQPVWEDSCVEFFCQVPGEKMYMNFETNCIGTMVASRRFSRTENIVPFSSAQMATIQRWSSLGERCVITGKDATPTDWEVKIGIPWALLLGHTPSFPLTLRVNFYKCGDKTKYPHFVSWSPIQTSEPDFHRPEFFREITLG
ncbi:MAG: hypothetical protein MJZ20_12510 [Bacteroidaceae bacterium]|nr:hypothetical protein [Bacteroidaceae bacterium]